MQPILNSFLIYKISKLYDSSSTNNQAYASQEELEAGYRHLLTDKNPEN